MINYYSVNMCEFIKILLYPFYLIYNIFFKTENNTDYIKYFPKNKKTVPLNEEYYSGYEADSDFPMVGYNYLIYANTQQSE